MNTHNNLPLYTMDVDGNGVTEDGVEFVALVDRPAIRRGFLAFRDEAPRPMVFSVTSEDRRIVSGPLMLADTPIYRSDEEGEYYVTFPAAVIERIARKFARQGNHANVNEMHDSDRQVAGVVMFETWLTDSTRGTLPLKGYEDAPEGSWFGSFAVDNEEVWQQIKTGAFTGFSVEGIFSRLIPSDAPAAQQWWDDPAHAFSAEEREGLAALEALLKNLP